MLKVGEKRNLAACPHGEMALGNSRYPVRTCWRAPNVPDAVMFHAQYDRDFIPHSHDAATILIVTDGVVDIGVDHRKYRAHQGQMVVVGANQIHSAHLVGSDGWTMRNSPSAHFADAQRPRW